jgi:hypothetical protein
MKPIDAEQHFPWYADSDDTTFIDCQCGAPCDGIAGWATHISEETEQPMSSPTPLRTFAEVWSRADLIHDLAEKLRCEEVEALAGIIRRVLGSVSAADDWIGVHAAGDDCDDMHCQCGICAVDA